eukprot:CAMPEP_0196583254 /NCGR_PEP_ID=MMETSP1081-20130531/42711_1 /TAXON_ID=36882 /ORGANISM="Pyramimonas amylifera, Strain CCMP720" /LENGTH=60 /DNA_ID=CAMNT_0041904077 /DNA_START=80 /DNA_END=262 /DNA_ORIENTATION=+
MKGESSTIESIVGHGNIDHIFKDYNEDTTILLEDSPSDARYIATAGQAANGWLCYSLNDL